MDMDIRFFELKICPKCGKVLKVIPGSYTEKVCSDVSCRTKLILKYDPKAGKYFIEIK